MTTRTRAEIRVVMEQTMHRYPRLNLAGFVMPVRVSARGPDYYLERERLLAAEHEFEVCCAWLATLPRRKTINIKRTSAMLVEMIYQDMECYTVRNGTMIVALVHSGIPLVQCEPGSYNAFVAISERAFL